MHAFMVDNQNGSSILGVLYIAPIKLSILQSVPPIGYVQHGVSSESGLG